MIVSANLLTVLASDLVLRLILIHYGAEKPPSTLGTDIFLSNFSSAVPLFIEHIKSPYFAFRYPATDNTDQFGSTMTLLYYLFEW